MFFKLLYNARLFLSLVLILASLNSYGFGVIGHRVVGELAWRHLKGPTKKKVKALLGHQSLAEVSTWADEIRSDPAWNLAAPWHYVNIADGETYQNSKKAPGGDIIEAIGRFEAILKNDKNPSKERAEALKFLVHFIGDLHQPLHVGLEEDRGGNLVKVQWFEKHTNLHAIWDEDLIEFEKYSYTEYAKILDYLNIEEIKEIQKGDVVEWAMESKNLRALIYPQKNEKLSYQYHYQFKPLLRDRLQKAGIRLAYILESNL